MPSRLEAARRTHLSRYLPLHSPAKFAVSLCAVCSLRKQSLRADHLAFFEIKAWIANEGWEDDISLLLQGHRAGVESRHGDAKVRRRRAPECVAKPPARFEEQPSLVLATEGNGGPASLARTLRRDGRDDIVPFR